MKMMHMFECDRESLKRLNLMLHLTVRETKFGLELDLLVVWEQKVSKEQYSKRLWQANMKSYVAILTSL
jgi:hypothetical protein